MILIILRLYIIGNIDHVIQVVMQFNNKSLIIREITTALKNKKKTIINTAVILHTVVKIKPTVIYFSGQETKHINE